MPERTAVRSPFTDADYPAHPYPGARPGCSFVHSDGVGRVLRPDSSAPSGWRVGDGGCLDDWLAERGAEPMRGRQLVLAYGSNACPAKITWLRAELGLTGPVVALSARCTGLSAVWAAGLRIHDGQRPAVLTAAPGVVEDHALWFATPEQRQVLDVCEGRGVRYRLVHLHGPERIQLADGSAPQRVLAYAAAGPQRAPLLVDGRPVRCTDVDQLAARALTGTPATGDGLTCTEIAGEPVW
ncbi:gamma-glutamylcyclotransferase [Saccharopolyspora indica]|uniref:gamma-glutamylcyclotransferase n=1 Tax=Saccharopolyspora indica TaxID=1229659 RepID=UPI0022EA8402|nr:gamma-glutamylcyclotransferase [Saccharopolyspora indica]MDA3645657.1 gamma-glutamylcyclotransferase [Saccharopolyspora indica]